MNEAMRALFEAWLVNKLKELQLPGVTTSREMELLWQAFKAGWDNAEEQIKWGGR